MSLSLEEATQNLLCDCKEFVKELLTFARDSFSCLNDQNLQRINFKVFVKQHSCRINEVNHVKTSSEALCTLILKTKTLERRRDTCNRNRILINILYVISLMYEYHEQTGFHHPLLLLSYGSSAWRPDVGYTAPPYSVYALVGYEGEDYVEMSTAFQGKLEFMKLLINFDFLSSLNYDNNLVIKLSLIRALKEFRWTLIKDAGNTDDDPLSNTYDYIRTIKIDAIVKMAENVFFCDNYYGRYKRMFLTTIAIEAATLKLKKEENKAQVYVHCLRMYFTSTRDPFITINEVRSMLYACLTVLEELHIFQPLYEEFVKIIPECSAKFQPRSLTDLVRCKIRENLKKCDLPLPEAILKLRLPKPMKEFILGNVIQMSRITGNIHPEQVITMSQLNEMSQIGSRDSNELFLIL